MADRILWVSDNSMEQFAPMGGRDEQEFIFKNMYEHAKKVARPSTEIDVSFVSENAGEAFALQVRYARIFIAAEIVEKVSQAEQDGFDAAFAGQCYGEYFLQDARQAVKMPVVGPAESAMMLAQLLGHKFAVVTVHPSFVFAMEESIRFHGWQGRAIDNQPVRHWEPDVSRLMLDAYDGRPDQLIEEFDREAKKCVAAGADVVICGCNPYGAALSQVGYNEVTGTGVPVVTALASMVRYAEMLIDAKRSSGWSKSEAALGPYRSSPPEILEDLAQRGIGLPQLRRKESEPASGASTRELSYPIG